MTNVRGILYSLFYINVEQTGAGQHFLLIKDPHKKSSEEQRLANFAFIGTLLKLFYGKIILGNITK